MNVIGAALSRAAALRTPLGSRRRRSQRDFHAIPRDFDPAARKFGRLRGGLVQNGIGVIDVHQDPARGGRQTIQPLEHPARTALRKVADIAGPLSTKSRGRSSHRPSRTCRPPAHRRRIAWRPTTARRWRPIPEHTPQFFRCFASSMTSARLSPSTGAVAVRRVRRRLAGDRQRAPPHPRHRVHRENRVLQVDAAAVHAAKVTEHLKDRVAAGQIRIGAVCAPHGPRTHRFSQHVQPGRMVDLPVNEDDGGNGGVAYRTARLQIRTRLQLGQDVRRGVHQHPSRPPSCDGDGRLGPGTAVQCSRAKTRAVWAIAIPLGKTAPGGRTQHPDFHEGGRRRPHARAHALASQRFDTYIVISIPNRNSMACGVSHFISKLLFEVPPHGPPAARSAESAAS